MKRKSCISYSFCPFSIKRMADGFWMTFAGMKWEKNQSMKKILNEIKWMTNLITWMWPELESPSTCFDQLKILFSMLKSKIWFKFKTGIICRSKKIRHFWIALEFLMWKTVCDNSEIRSIWQMRIPIEKGNECDVYVINQYWIEWIHRRRILCWYHHVLFHFKFQKRCAFSFFF